MGSQLPHMDVRSWDFSFPEKSMSEAKSVAHKHDMNSYGLQEYPDLLVSWRDAKLPDFEPGRLRGCGYCGSMHPADVAEAIRQGASGHWADRKYGWPHKAYFDGVPNPHAGMLEHTSSCNRKDDTFCIERREPRFNERTGERIADYVTYYAHPQPSPLRTHGKFYSVHLQDASPEDRALIEQHLGLAFTFMDDGRVSWRPVTVDAVASADA